MLVPQIATWVPGEIPLKNGYAFLTMGSRGWPEKGVPGAGLARFVVLACVCVVVWGLMCKSRAGEPKLRQPGARATKQVPTSFIDLGEARPAGAR